jgi:hypothetical protein
MTTTHNLNGFADRDELMAIWTPEEDGVPYSHVARADGRALCGQTYYELRRLELRPAATLMCGACRATLDMPQLTDEEREAMGLSPLDAGYRRRWEDRRARRRFAERWNERRNWRLVYRRRAQR